MRLPSGSMPHMLKSEPSDLEKAISLPSEDQTGLELYLPLCVSLLELLEAKSNINMLGFPAVSET